MKTVQIKPLSVNRAWQGRRFKTEDYKVFEKEMIYNLPSDCEIPEGDLFVHYVFGVSNKAQDWDGPVKLVQDILQKKYGFNDNKIMEAYVQKVITKKGQEFISFAFYPLSEVLIKTKEIPSYIKTNIPPQY